MKPKRPFKLTEYQKQVYRYILKHPTATYPEIRDALGFGFVGSVQSVVRALHLKGLVGLYKVKDKFKILKRLKI